MSLDQVEGLYVGWTQIYARENLWKAKLGTRVVGLNRNQGLIGDTRRLAL